LVTNERAERRLAAILAADMVGFSRLMEADESGTLARQKALRAELIDPEIESHKGRIVKTTGDGLLIEFASVIDAAECAVTMQRALAVCEPDVPADKRMQYRMGLNLGDIVIDGDDIFGDGVNVAARLESLADPGGLCISGIVHDAIAGKLDLNFEDLGEKEVKNISTPVRTFALRLDGPTVAAPVVDSASEQLSVAVLPFENMSDDPEQEFFVDGLTEDLITELSRFKDLFVISRTSMFTYKGKQQKIGDIATAISGPTATTASLRTYSPFRTS
jgi:adenylate cyclase